MFPPCFRLRVPPPPLNRWGVSDPTPGHPSNPARPPLTARHPPSLRPRAGSVPPVVVCGGPAPRAAAVDALLRVLAGRLGGALRVRRVAVLTEQDKACAPAPSCGSTGPH